MWNLRNRSCGGRIPALRRLWISPLQTSPAQLVYGPDGNTVEDPKVSSWLEVAFSSAELSEKGKLDGGDWVYEQTLTITLGSGPDGRENALYMSRLGEACRWHLLVYNGAKEFWLAGVTDGFAATEHSFSMARSSGELNTLTFTATDRFPAYPVRYDYTRFGMTMVDPMPASGSYAPATGGSGSNVWDPFRKLGDFFGYDN